MGTTAIAETYADNDADERNEVEGLCPLGTIPGRRNRERDGLGLRTGGTRHRPDFNRVGTRLEVVQQNRILAFGVLQPCRLVDAVLKDDILRCVIVEE